MHRLLIKLQVPFCLHVIRTRQSQAQHTDLTKKLKERAEDYLAARAALISQLE